MVAFLVNSNFTPSVDISLQQLFRVRNLTDGDMSIFLQDAVHYTDDLPSTESDVESLLRGDVSLLNKYYLTSQLSALAQHKIVGDTIRYDSDRMSYRVIKGIILMRNRSLSQYLDLLCCSLREDYGITVTVRNMQCCNDHFDVDTAILACCAPISNFPPFASLENLALTPEGRYRYEMLNEAQTPLSEHDRAEKFMYEIAIQMWKIPADKLDEAFYKELVAHRDAKDLYYRAKRFVMMSTHNILFHRQRLRDKLQAIMCSDDSNIQLYKTKLREHYTKLISGQTLLSDILSDDQQACLRKWQPVTLSMNAIDSSYTRFLDQLEPVEKKTMMKIFEISDTTASFIAVRKIASLAFGMEIRRASKSCRLAGFKVIHMDTSWLASLKARFEPALLSL